MFRSLFRQIGKFLEDAPTIIILVMIVAGVISILSGYIPAQVVGGFLLMLALAIPIIQSGSDRAQADYALQKAQEEEYERQRINEHADAVAEAIIRKLEERGYLK